MLTRYHMRRGSRPKSDPLPKGIRQDTRKHTRHFLRPTTEMVNRYLEEPTTARWRDFARAYKKLLTQRMKEDRTPFDRLAQDAAQTDVHLGCSCPTKKNPDIRRCHTWLALEFMRARYRNVKVVFPAAPR